MADSGQDDYAALIAALSDISSNQEKQQALQQFNQGNEAGHMVGKVYVGDSPLQHLGSLGQLAVAQGRAGQDQNARQMFMRQLVQAVRGQGGQAQPSQSMAPSGQIPPDLMQQLELQDGGTASI